MKQLHTSPSSALLASCLALCLASCLALGLVSCMDEKLLSTSNGNPIVSNEKDMYLRVNTYSGDSSDGTLVPDDKKIRTLDVLVFAPGIGENATKFYVRSACEGVWDKESKSFQVEMPIGQNFKVHVFANCHKELVAGKVFYASTGSEMKDMLSKLAITTPINGLVGEPAEPAPLPMHGFRSGITIEREMANNTIEVNVLRSVAAVKVMTHATITENNENKTITPGELPEANFELRSVRAYYQAASGQVAPLFAGETTTWPEVTAENTPLTLSDTLSVKPFTEPVVITSEASVNQLDALYLFENQPWSDNGLDQPSSEKNVATTRLVIGGVYDKATTDGTTPKESYYRVDIADAAGKLTSILRNHQYILNILSVAAPGFDTPEEAAAVASINITIQVIEWKDELTNVDFDRENYFKTPTKQIDLARNVGSTRVITVESDVPTDKWGWKFGETTNGGDTTNGGGTTEFIKGLAAALSNNRFTVEGKVISEGEKPPYKVTLTFTAKKAFATLAAGETHTNTLLLKVNNLTVHFNLRQIDKSLDDWGNGGEGSNNVGGRDEEGVIDEATKDPWGDGNGATGSEDEKTQID